jgi:phosphate transport system protein
MRNRFDRQLDELNRNLTEMGSCCEECIGQVAVALSSINEISRSHESGVTERLIEKIYESDAEIDKLERTIENQCLRLLLEQQPVARDLRYVSAALKMISDMERIGDQCSDIADIAKYLSTENKGTLESAVHIQDMASATMNMVMRAVDSFIKRNLEIAKVVEKSDDVVDELFVKVKEEIAEMISRHPEQGESLLDLLMVAKYFERIGDHATNIAEWVEFSINGERPLKVKYQFDEASQQEIKIDKKTS